MTANHHESLHAILIADPIRWRALGQLMALHLPDAWIGAGFIRNAVWDHCHGRSPRPPGGDVDVLWFDPAQTDPAVDTALQTRLLSHDPTLDWSVRNQARMHLRNGDPPYASSIDAMRHWPETATAVAVRRACLTGIEIAAPFGLDDLFALVIRPTPVFLGAKHATFLDRIQTKNWLMAWPHLRLG